MGQLAAATFQPGSIVVVNFPGAVVVKHRPAVILSTTTYHSQRPDVILGLITGNVAAATADSDYILQDWQAAGLCRQSAFRTYLITVDRCDIVGYIGCLSARDWKAVQIAFKTAVAVV